MSVQNEGVKPFTAGEALEAYRRVKLSSASGTQVEYADAGQDAIGITQRKEASGANVAVALLSKSRTFKAVASEAISVGAVLYGAADGKVSDTVSGMPIGVALAAASGDGSVIEVLAIAPLAMAPELQLFSAVVTDADTADVAIATLPYAFQIIDYWVISRDTTAANITLKNAGTLVSSAVLAKGTTDEAIVRAATLLAAQDTVAAGAALTVEASAVAAFDIFVSGYRVS